MTKDSLGDRMKNSYENKTKTYLPKNTNTIIRIDGCHFHTFTKGFEKPFDDILIKAMQNTTVELCKNIQCVKFGYTQSDEISLVLTDYDNPKTSMWFDGAVQKICSVSASMAALYFNKAFQTLASPYIFEAIQTENPEEKNAYFNASVEGAVFDARCFTLPDQDEVVNYFIWRQQDAIRNSTNSLAQSIFPQKELQGLKQEDVKRKLSDEGCSWYDLSEIEKYGTIIVKGDNGWGTVKNTPIFVNKKDVLFNMLPKIL